MQSSLFANSASTTDLDKRFHLQNPQMLRARLGGGHPPELLARNGTMVAYTGAIDFDGYMQSGAEQQAAQRTGEQLNLMMCRGEGNLYLANMAQAIHIIDLHQEGLTVDGQYVLALDPGLTWNVVSIESQQSVAGVGAFSLDIGGTGKLVVMTSGKPLVMQVTPQKEVFADADAVVAWSTHLHIGMESQVTSQRVYSRRRGTGEGWNMSFRGQGYVIVQPSEMLPPAEFITSTEGVNWLNNRGMGNSSMRGNTWGS
jgi:uncharacterized protein (AIM24 family)